VPALLRSRPRVFSRRRPWRRGGSLGDCWRADGRVSTGADAAAFPAKKNDNDSVRFGSTRHPSTAARCSFDGQCAPVTAPPHVYHLNPVRLLVIPAIGLGFVALLTAAALLPDVDGDNGVWWVVGFVALVFAAAFLIIWQSRLELTDEGIVHYQFGYTVRSAWENVESISLVRGAEGLYLRQPGTHSALLRGSSRLLNLAMGVSALPSLVGDPAALARGDSWPSCPLRGT
jgi:hypothetical protein